MIYLYALVSLVLALVGEIIVHKKMVLISIKHKFTDDPNSRKLNKRPVPVLGGLAVTFGVLFSISVMNFVDGSFAMLFTPALALLCLLMVGGFDDLVDLNYRIKFFFQFFAVAILIFQGGFIINNFHGLWGVYGIPYWLAITLSFFASVGIINSINLIDGVDGLSSGMCILAFGTFGVYFVAVGDVIFAALAFASVGALLPFLVYNVFGKKYKMYIGDSGALSSGVVLSAMVMKVIDMPETTPQIHGVVSFLIAILAIPVFDCIRVTMTRCFHGKGPFAADKTHLHHIFIDLGLSHVLTSFTEILLNLLIIIAWFVMELCGVDQDIQLYVVIGMGILFTFGIYHTLDYLRKNHPQTLVPLQNRFANMRYGRKGFCLWMRARLDGKGSKKHQY